MSGNHQARSSQPPHKKQWGEAPQVRKQPTTREILREFYEYARVEHERLREHRVQLAWRQLRQMVERNREVHAKLTAATGRPMPASTQEWVILAAEYEYPGFGQGEFSEELIYAWVIGRARAGQQLMPRGPRRFTASRLCEMTLVSRTTLNKHAKQAGVATPGRGHRNHRYTLSEALRIVDDMCEHMTDKRALEKVKAARQKLVEIKK